MPQVTLSGVATTEASSETTLSASIQARALPERQLIRQTDFDRVILEYVAQFQAKGFYKKEETPYVKEEDKERFW